MPAEGRESVTRILAEMADGDRSAAADLLAHVYDELHRLAVALFRDQRAGHTLQPTALVHEAYLKLSASDGVRETNRAEYLALASTVMRHLLVDHARSRHAAKRGGGRERVTLSALSGDQPGNRVDVLALEEALGKLVRLNARDAQLVELRYFGGLTSEEAAEVLGISRTEAARRWRTTRAWLADELRELDVP
ncbi:MAG: sigma-70 family RNA polymerase sigma factor [Phycisphaerales bacterium]|nr:sigma-70 family RNA polymerase sigma factor [Phycisphaerales bacterium]